MIQSTLQIDSGGSVESVTEKEREHEQKNQNQSKAVVETPRELEQYAPGSKRSVAQIDGYYHGPDGFDGATHYVEILRYSIPEDRKRYKPRKDTISCNAIVRGVDSYVERYGIEEIDYPSYYSQFSDFGPIVYKWTAHNNKIGLGVKQQLLRGLIRVANGSGRIDAEKTHAIACKNDTVLVTGPRGAFFADMWGISPDFTDQQPPESVYTDVCGFKVPEEHSGTVDAMAQFIKTVHEFGDHEIADYEYQRDKARHIFRAADGKPIRSHWSWLRDRQPVDDIIGTKQITHDGRLFELDIDEADLKYSIGDVVEDDLSAVTGIVVGHRYKQTTNEYVYSGGVCGIDVSVEYLLMDYDDIGSGYRYSFTTESQTIASFSV